MRHPCLIVRHSSARRTINWQRFIGTLMWTAALAGTAPLLNAQDSQPVVRLVYLVPSDRPVRNDYVAALAAAAKHLQIWYRNEMGDGTTFRLHSPVVEVLATSHPASFYSGSFNSSFELSFWFNVLDDAFALTGGQFNDPQNIWGFYIDADPLCGQALGAAAGVVVLPSNDLRGLAGEPNVPPCPDQPADTAGVCRWVGGLGHELGHAFGLPHPRGCEAPDTTTVCPNEALMWLGYRTYPAAFLLPEEKTQLATTPFFSPVSLPTSLPDCSDLLSVDATPPQLTVSLTPATLWPPNHKLVPVAASIMVTDDRDPAPVVTLISIVSNEPANGAGDGQTETDIQLADIGSDDRSFLLRAERSGGGAGRVYTVTYEAVDTSGNVTRVSDTVTVR